MKAKDKDIHKCDSMVDIVWNSLDMREDGKEHPVYKDK
jgi:hypothetical protein